jgi:hypothetical protein
MPQKVKEKGKKLTKCSWCGKTISSEPIAVKTCCVNKPWYFAVRCVTNNLLLNGLKIRMPSLKEKAP